MRQRGLVAVIGGALALAAVLAFVGPRGRLGGVAGGGADPLAGSPDASLPASALATAPGEPPPLPAIAADEPEQPAAGDAAPEPPPAEATDRPRVFTLKVGESLPLTPEQQRELAIAARRERRATLPGTPDNVQRLAHVDPAPVAADEIPDGDAAALDGMHQLAGPEGETPAAEGVTTAVTGVVLDDATGGPVVAARVALFSAFYQPHLFYDRQLGELGGGVTDVDGRFRFAAVNLDDLHYRGGAGLLLVITHPTIASWSGAPVVPLSEGILNDLGTFRCEPVGIALGGQVRHRDGRPLPGLLVTLSPDNPVNVAKPERQLLLKSLPHAVTDGDGRWRIAGLRPGRAWLSVHAALDGVLFQEIAIAESRDDVNLAVRVGGQVTGRILDRAGRPIPSARIDGSGNTTHSLADGTFLLENLDSSGPFTLHVTHHAYYPRDVAEIQDGARDLEVLLEPLPLATLSIRQGADFAPCTECEIVYEGPPAALARVPTSPYRRSASGEYAVILYPEITSVRVYREGYAERRLAASALAGGARTEVELQPSVPAAAGSAAPAGG